MCFMVLVITSFTTEKESVEHPFSFCLGTDVNSRLSCVAQFFGAFRKRWKNIA
jgi:hypothetical protein